MIHRPSRVPRLPDAAGWLIPRPLKQPLVLGCGLGWFALELIRARMVQPRRTLRCFRLLGCFLRAQGCARRLLPPLPVGSLGDLTESRRYARNCIVLMALQPEMGADRIRLSSDWVLPATLFGACIPLYDGCLDRLPTRRARAFGDAVAEILMAAQASADGTLGDLAAILGRHGASRADAASWQALITRLETWLREQPPERRQLILRWMVRMNEAQLASLGERNVTLGLAERRRLSSRKGGISFLLLRCLCLPLDAAPTGSDDRSRAALLQAAAVAQWIDDYADIHEDRRLGIQTFIGQLDAGGRATTTIRRGIREAGAALRAIHGQRAEAFVDSLALYFAIKRSGRVAEQLGRSLGISRAGTIPGAEGAATAPGPRHGWP